MCIGCLPTCVKLQDKWVKCPFSCMICDAPFEDLNHVFFNCAFVVRVWNWSGLWDVIQHALSLTTTTVYTIFHLLHELARENSPIVLPPPSRVFWKHRNLKLWQEIAEIVT